MANTAKAGKIPADKNAKAENKTQAKNGKVIDLKTSKIPELSATLNVTPDREFFNKVRSGNLKKFKDNIREHIIALEVNNARINIEEKLLNCGNVTYLTEQEAIADDRRDARNKELMEISGLLLMTAISLGIYLYLTRRALIFY